MKKKELVAHIAREAGISTEAASAALKATEAGIRQALQAGERIILTGFGSFYVSQRAERQTRNPRTGQPMLLKAARVAHFRPGKGLKTALNTN